MWLKYLPLITYLFHLMFIETVLDTLVISSAYVQKCILNQLQSLIY